MMVLVRTNVSSTVYELLVREKEVEAITDFDKDGFRESYQFLKELSGFDNFFFGLVAESSFSRQIEELCDMSSTENSVKLLLDIPAEEIVATEYYEFSDLIYYTDCEIDNEIADRIREYMIENKNSYSFDDSDQVIIQVIYRSIKAEYILEVY